MEPGRGVMPRELEGAEKNQPLKRGWLAGGESAGFVFSRMGT